MKIDHFECLIHTNDVETFEVHSHFKCIYFQIKQLPYINITNSSIWILLLTNKIKFYQLPCKFLVRILLKTRKKNLTISKLLQFLYILSRLHYKLHPIYIFYILTSYMCKWHFDCIIVLFDVSSSLLSISIQFSFLIIYTSCCYIQYKCGEY